MKKKQIIGDKVTFSINTDEPINVKDLVDGLVAFSNEYVSSAKLKDTAVQITEVRKGSYIFDAIMVTKDHILPLMENANITREFIEGLNKLKKFFSSPNYQKDEDLPSKQDSENMRNMLQPIYNITNNGSMTINLTNNTNTIEGFSVSAPEARIIRENASNHIKRLDTQKQTEDEINDFTNKLIYFVQTRINSKDKGQKAVCEE